MYGHVDLQSVGLRKTIALVELTKYSRLGFSFGLQCCSKDELKLDGVEVEKDIYW